ncbi:hypothetical protein KCU71_g4535, partial [Aureobasidium melanogenum]
MNRRGSLEAHETKVGAHVASSPAIAALTNRIARTSVWRTMSKEEVWQTRNIGGLAPGITGADPAKFVAETPKYVKAWDESGGKPIVRFDMKKKAYMQFRNNIPPYERQSDLIRSGWHAVMDPKSKKRCVAFAANDLEQANAMIHKVKVFDNAKAVREHNTTRFLSSKRGLLTAGGIVVTIALEATAISLAVEADGGKFGRQTTASLASSGTAIASSMAIAAALGSVWPGIGTLAATLIAGLASSVSAFGTSEMVLFFWREDPMANVQHSSSLQFEDLHELLVGEDSVLFDDSALEYAKEAVIYNDELEFDERSMIFDSQELEYGWQHRRL